MTDRNDQRRLDRLALQYLAALDAADFDAVAALWHEAETDADLADALHALNAELADDARRAEVSAVAAAVAAHLPSAEVARPAAGPVTVADVAAELRRRPPARMPAAVHALTDRLTAADDALPDDLALPKLIAWAEARYGAAPAGYWDAFRDAALLVRLRREAAAEYQLAARKGGRA